MSWQVKSQHIDKAIGHHVIHLHNPEIGAEHVVQIVIGQDSCPLCGHVKPKNNLDQIDPRVIVRDELHNLEKVHEQITAYAQKHNVPVKRLK